jgi:hypothetical protein
MINAHALSLSKFGGDIHDFIVVIAGVHRFCINLGVSAKFKVPEG